MLDADLVCCAFGLQASQTMQQEAEAQAAAADARASALEVHTYPTCTTAGSLQLYMHAVCPNLDWSGSIFFSNASSVPPDD